MKSAKLAKRIAADSRRTVLRELQTQDAAPFFRRVESAVEPITVVDGRPRIMLASNNYLGLANHPDVVGAALCAVERFGAAMLGSRLYTGTTDVHTELEYELAEWHGTEDAIVFTTGYQTSVGAICGLVGVGDTVVVDSAIHASIQDGCRLSGASVRTFRHNDPDSLRAELDRVANRDGMALVVVEGLYSMAGDLAPLVAFADLCVEYGAAMMVDEAHSVGVFGDRRTGLAELCGVEGLVEMRMGTFSKALASTGGFIAGSRDLVDTLRVNARSFIFSMSAVPAALGSALAAVRIARGDEGRDLTTAVLNNAATLRTCLRDMGIVSSGETVLESGQSIGGPIVSVPLGDEMTAVGVWNRVYEAGVFAGLSMFPAVAPGQAILRMSVMATHTPVQLQTAATAVAEAVNATRPVADQPN
jgi:8-amino-7-oxononanoate synthase